MACSCPTSSVLLLALALSSACGGGSDGSSDGDGSSDTTESSITATTSGSTGSSDTGSGSCEEVPEGPATLAECSLPEPCGSVFAYGEFGGSCIGPLDDGNDYSANETCVLETLAAGEPAVIHVEGSCSDVVLDRFVYLLGGGVVMTTSVSGGPCFGCGCDDWSEDWSPVRRCTLKAAADFEACLAEADPTARVACMTQGNWTTDCVETSAACSP